MEFSLHHGFQRAIADEGKNVEAGDKLCEVAR